MAFKRVVYVVFHIQRIGCQPEKTTSHGGQSRSWSAEQGKENKRESLASMLVFHAQLLSQLNDVAPEVTNDCCTSHSLQPVTCLRDGPPQLRIPGVHFQALPRCVHRISRSLKLSFRLGVATTISLWSLRSLCGITNSAVRMMAAANAASTSSKLLSPGEFAPRCLPTAVATSCRSWGSVTRRLWPSVT